MGPCSSGNDNQKYKEVGSYTERCCLKSGLHILSCLTTGGSLGWKHVHIRINGHIYCDDFISIKAMRTVSIHGMYPIKYQISIIFNICSKKLYVYILNLLPAQSLTSVEPSNPKLLNQDLKEVSLVNFIFT